MTNYKIDIYRFFREARNYPWDVLGHDYPKYGRAHSYLCKILAPFAHPIEKALLMGNPSMNELHRLDESISFAVQNNQLNIPDNAPPFCCGDIWAYCNDLTNAYKKVDVAQQVLDYLKDDSIYTDWAHKQLNYLWKQGSIIIPEKYLEEVREKPKEEYSKWGY